MTDMNKKIKEHKLSKHFNNWEWLKDSSGSWSYARVTGVILSLLLQPIILAFIYSVDYIEKITNVWQWLIICSPFLFSTLNFLIDIFRDNKSLQIKIGDKTYGFDKSETGEGTK